MVRYRPTDKGGEGGGSSDERKSSGFRASSESGKMSLC